MVTREQFLHSRYTVFPNRLLANCVYSEVGGGLVFAADGVAQEICQGNGSVPLWIVGRGIAHEPYFPGVNIRRHKILHRIYSDHLAGQQAYAMAGIGPDDIDVFECHDAFVRQLFITCAEFGFVPLGQTHRILDKMYPHGKLRINRSGGLLFCGHGVGWSNGQSMFFTRQEMLEHGLTHGLVHGTGASLAQYGTAMIVRAEERRAS